MSRFALSSALLASVLLASGCAATPRDGMTQPVLAAYFDCVRETGAAISAHRARSSDDQPENSVAAIEATGRAIPGAIVEVDVALTADGRLVLMHDLTLDRTTTGSGRLADLTFDQVQATRLIAMDGTVTTAPPPTLAEALEAADGVRAIVSLDFKPADDAGLLGLARLVIEAVREADAQDRVILITSAETARAVAALAPEMMLSAATNDGADLDGLNPAQILGWTGNREPRPDLWRALRARGVEAQFGTLGAPGRRLDDVYAADGDVGEYRSLYRDGVTIFATDAPLAVLSVLGPEIVAAARCKR